jgi:hypothetical protein
MAERHTWTVEILLSEDEDRTRADAYLRAPGREVAAWGRARRNPADADLPSIGEELAAARALSELAHRLLSDAADTIERTEGRAVELHL